MPGNWVWTLQLQQYRLWFRQTVGKEIVLDWLGLKDVCSLLTMAVPSTWCGKMRESRYRSSRWIHPSVCAYLMQFVRITLFCRLISIFLLFKNTWQQNTFSVCLNGCAPSMPPLLYGSAEAAVANPGDPVHSLVSVLRLDKMKLC